METPWKWTEKDLLGLIETQTQESIGLDYKACLALEKTDKKKTEISKDVSAFANSAGGTIAYGIIEKGHVPVKLDRGFDPNETSREWLEQVINSRIRRKIDGIRINPVELKQTNPGRVAYVVYVPQSIRAPHQAHDKRFYKRYNFQSVPMEEYEIRDVARREETPDLHVDFHLVEKRPKLEFTDDEQYSMPIEIGASISNCATMPAEFAVITLFLDRNLVLKDTADLSDELAAEKPLLDLGATRVPVHVLRINWAVPAKMPIFSGVNFRIPEHPMKVAVPRGDKEFLLGWEVQSPGMGAKSGFSALRCHGGHVEIVPASRGQ